MTDKEAEDQTWEWRQRDRDLWRADTNYKERKVIAEERRRWRPGTNK